MFFLKRQSAVSRIVVFLGNPGAKYAGSRHNAGFMTADAYALKHGVKIDRVKFKALTAVFDNGGEKLLLLKPQTYMNLSGQAVQPAAAFYKVPPENILVVSDDISLPLGTLRLRRSGSAGGHNGLKSIISVLGDGFPRLKIGVGQPPEGFEVVDWVLSGFHGEDAKIMAEAANRAADAVDAVIENGIDKAMNKFNG